MFDAVLVANRGEIACRIIDALGALGIRSVAVFSDADAGARHATLADTAVHIGAAPPAESYLNIPKIIEAARAAGVDAIHPGYGFLAENAAFARACAEAGLVFIGPDPRALEIMGDKIRAKTHVAAGGVPVVPGVARPGLTDAELAEAAAGVGFPVLIKPSAGGGGKGMHVAHNLDELPAALAQARREAAGAFGSDELLIERLITSPRHIEVQVLADNSGHTVHLGERECSLQRRHQKIIEEAPSPLLDGATRERIGQAAIDTAQSVGYRGAGTVEFIVSADAPEEFFFMEMNTRLQVEHPVTEMVTGIDLVRWQIRITAGEPLTISQSEVRFSGHAIEARVYAENPAAGFLPTGGTVLALAEPTGERVRVDSSLATGLNVSPDYDPMLAKVIAHGPGRPAALRRLDRALADTAVLGVGTNVEFLRTVLADPAVRAGNLDTGLIERKPLSFAGVDFHAHAAGALILRALAEPARPTGRAGANVPAVPAHRWDVADGWRVGAPAPTRIELSGLPTAWLTGSAAGQAMGGAVTIDGVTAPASADITADTALVTVDGLTRPYRFARSSEVLFLFREGVTWELVPRRAAARTGAAAALDPELRSPMPGSVVSIETPEGARVEQGAPILVVEAMKMEHVLRAPHPGTVAIHARVGAHVTPRDGLATVTPDTGHPEDVGPVNGEPEEDSHA